jgi:hypothetical protein
MTMTSIVVPTDGGGSYRFTHAFTVQSWTARNGTGRTLIAPSPVSFPTASDQAVWRAHGSPDLAALIGERRSDRPNRADSVAAQAFRLPTDPHRLQQLIDGTSDSQPTWLRGRSTEDNLWRLLQTTPMSAEARAELYRLAGRMSGVHYVDHVTDPLGREGVGFWFDERGLRFEMIVNPSTGLPLAALTIQPDPGSGATLPPGTITAYPARNGVEISTVYLASDIVHSTRTRP